MPIVGFQMNRSWTRNRAQENEEVGKKIPILAPIRFYLSRFGRLSSTKNTSSRAAPLLVSKTASAPRPRGVLAACTRYPITRALASLYCLLCTMGRDVTHTFDFAMKLRAVTDTSDWLRIARSAVAQAHHLSHVWRISVVCSWLNSVGTSVLVPPSLSLSLAGRRRSMSAPLSVLKVIVNGKHAERDRCTDDMPLFLISRDVRSRADGAQIEQSLLSQSRVES